MKRSLLIFAAFYKDLTPKCGSTIRIAGYTKGLEELGVDYQFISDVKPDYVPIKKYIASNLNSKWLKLFVLHNLFYSNIFLRPLSFLFRFLLCRLNGVKHLKKVSQNSLIWTPQEYTVSLFLFTVFKQPFIYDIHGFFDIQREYRVGLSQWRKLWFDLFLLQERIVLKRAPYLNVVSEKMQNYVMERFSPTGLLLIAPDGIPENLSAYKKMEADTIFREANHIEVADKIILYAGSFKKIGGVTELVRVYCNHPDIYKQAVLLLIGSGQEEENINSIVENSDCKQRVYRIKAMPHADLIAYMKASDVIVCPDIEGNEYNEMTPHIKLYDAIASGTPVVSSNFQVNREMFNENRFNISYFNYTIHDDFPTKIIASLKLSRIEQETTSNTIEALTYASRVEKYIHDYGTELQITKDR